MAGRGSVLLSAWIDGRWLLDCLEVPPIQEELLDEVGESQDRYRGAMATCGDADEGISNHCGEELQAYGIVAVAEELADAEMLLDPAEQELDLPAPLVELADLDGGARQVIGQKGDAVAFVALET